MTKTTAIVFIFLFSVLFRLEKPVNIRVFTIVAKAVIIIVYILPHNAMLSRYILWPCVHLSQISSSTKLAKHMIMQTMLVVSPGILDAVTC